MVTPNERKLVRFMVWLGLWKASVGLFRNLVVEPRSGTKWLYRWVKNRQVVDKWHHAPMCPANHWCRQALVFRPCNCGAAKHRVI